MVEETLILKMEQIKENHEAKKKKKEIISSNIIIIFWDPFR
ncbi:unnamed protein product [Gulo gulo]|uniref:Uncharacterized protein n=1 Tax=Gulo gulo TaxID=48420 RepID=A0A9X9Q0E0_GULGU|nr:unnamed protein product [Gulo gulo]